MENIVHGRRHRRKFVGSLALAGGALVILLVSRSYYGTADGPISSQASAGELNKKDDKGPEPKEFKVVPKAQRRKDFIKAADSPAVTIRVRNLRQDGEWWVKATVLIMNDTSETIDYQICLAIFDEEGRSRGDGYLSGQGLASDGVHAKEVKWPGNKDVQRIAGCKVRAERTILESKKRDLLKIIEE